MTNLEVQLRLTMIQRELRSLAEGVTGKMRTVIVHAANVLNLVKGS